MTIVVVGGSYAAAAAAVVVAVESAAAKRTGSVESRLVSGVLARVDVCVNGLTMGIFENQVEARTFNTQTLHMYVLISKSTHTYIHTYTHDS